MALPTILILGLLASSIAVISGSFESHATKVSENDDPFDNSVPSDPIMEMSHNRNKNCNKNCNKNKNVKKFTCPAIYGRYPHPESCEYYFECRFGFPTLFHCNKGYLYDRQKEQCRDKRHVRCHNGHDRDHDHHKEDKDKDKNKDKDKEIDVEEEKEENFKCPYVWGTFAHHKECSKYYICVFNNPKLFECYKNFLYDINARRCLPSNKVKCGKRLDRDEMRTSKRPVTFTTNRWKPITTPKPETTEAPKSNFHCPFPYGRYPDPEDCSRFYECRFSVPHLQTCPEGTLYHERKEQCLDKKTVKCDARPGGNDDDVVSEDDKNVDFRCPYVWGTFAHPVDCSKYIVCVYNVPATFNCRKHELFDAYHRRCFPKDKVTCGDRVNPDDPSEKTTISPVSSTLMPSTEKKLPDTTTTTTSEPTTTTTTTPEPTTTSPEPTTTTTTTLEPTTTTTTTTTPQPTTTTTTTTPQPTTTTTTTTPEPTTTTTTTTTPEPTTTTTTTTPEPTTTTTTTTPEPTTTTTTTPEPTTTTTTTTTTTPIPTTTTTTAVPTTLSTTIEDIFVPVTKPNTPPPTDCDKDDLDCIIDETGDITGWFDCPKRFGHFPHGSSRQLFIHCDNWRPFVKRCAEHTAFSPEYLVCVWSN